ncbi:MAG: MATE family efflux transporter [Lentisphaeria bacterium]|nr:MATE family efflux transporter [Lentisphaeria bacterium]
MAAEKKYKMDMCHGPLFGKIVRFAVPLAMANALSLMFHAADIMVVGKFASAQAMAAVGAAPAFTNLMLNLFWGISAGVNVLTARYTGAQDRESLFKTVHTAITVAIVGGIVLTVLGCFITRPVLEFMCVPEVIMDKACLYIWIWCIGSPFMILYSFGSAILRAIGDTKRPLIYMVIAGIVNVLLNLFFVLVCKMDVAGVAIATKISNGVSAVLVLVALTRSNEDYKLVWRKLTFCWPIFKEMLRIGIPAGVQGALFSVSNLIIQSTINSFGWFAIAGSSAALSLEGIIHSCATAFALTAVSFVGQNHGGRKYKRIVRSVFISMGCAIAIMILGGALCFLFQEELLSIYNSDPEVIRWGQVRIRYQLTFYALLAVMEVLTSSLRGLGYSFVPMIVTLMGACVFRVVWVYTILPMCTGGPMERMINLMISYPVSWVLVSLVNGPLLFFVCRRMLIRASRREFDDLTVK